MNENFKKHGAFSWSELLVNDVESAIDFYTKVIGWTVDEMQMPQHKYYVLKVDGSPVGGIMGKPNGYEHVPDHWGTYITVADVDKTLAKALQAGGKAIYPPMNVPGVGRMCAISDTSGAVVSIITYEDNL